jgi:hypothetical protein
METGLKWVRVCPMSLFSHEDDVLPGSTGNGPVYAGKSYRNFFLLLNFIPELTNIYIYIYYPFIFFYFSESISLFRF